MFSKTRKTLIFHKKSHFEYGLISACHAANLDPADRNSFEGEGSQQLLQKTNIIEEMDCLLTQTLSLDAVVVKQLFISMPNKKYVARIFIDERSDNKTILGMLAGDDSLSGISRDDALSLDIGVPVYRATMQ
jgi:hypothetical protein